MERSQSSDMPVVARYRGLLVQGLVVAVASAVIYWIVRNVHQNLQMRNIHSGYGFLQKAAGFEIAETPTLIFPGSALWGLIFLLLGGSLWIFRPWRRPIRRKMDSQARQRQKFYVPRLLLLTASLLWIFLAQIFPRTLDWWEALSFDAQRSYWIAFLTGCANTIKVSLVASLLATVLGLVIGICRLAPEGSRRARGASVYVNGIRNVPLLVQLVCWYAAILHGMPTVESSWRLGSIYLNNRGFFAPLLLEPAMMMMPLAVGTALFLLWRIAAFENLLRQERSGKSLRINLWAWLAGLLWLLCTCQLARTWSWEYPELVFGGRNIRGGWSFSPEFVALTLGLTFYGAAFVAEITRAGIAAVSRGQVEAARALGMGRVLIFSKIILPQALRLMIPPLTSQYLNCIKNSSLAVAIGFPDVVAVSSVILNQEGQSLEVLSMIMLFYLAVNLLCSMLLNMLNERLRIVGR